MANPDQDRSSNADEAGESEAGGRRGGALVIGALTMTSRVLGLVRDIVFAAYFFGRGLDAFALAFTVPNLFRRLFGEGALSGALVPELVKKIDEGDRAEGQAPSEARPALTGVEGAGRLASRVLGALALALGALSLAVVLVSAAAALALGTDSKAGLVAGLLAVVMPYVVLICGAAVVMAFLNSTRHFATPAAAPVILNVALITAALIRPSVWALAAAVLVGGALQLLAQMAVAKTRGMGLRPKIDLADPELRRVVRRLVPAVAGLAVFQVNVLLDRVIAEVMIPGDGAVGSLFLGNRLMQLPLAVFAISVGTAALPELSSHAARKDEAGHAGFREAFRAAASSILFWTVPAAAGLALVATPIVALLFDRGAFLGSEGALAKTSLVVVFYAPGLVAFGLAGLAARALYARGEPGPVVRASLYSVAVNLVLNIAFVLLFQAVALSPAVGERAASGEAGLALASSASGFVYLALLLSFLRAARPSSPKSPASGDSGKARRSASLWGLAVAAASLAAGGLAALAAQWFLLEAGAEAARGVWWAVVRPASYPAEAAWEWLWLVPKLPAAVCVGTFVALAVAVGVGEGGAGLRSDPGDRRARPGRKRPGGRGDEPTSARGGADRPLLKSLARTSLAAFGMGVFVNLVLSSLPPLGPTWSFAAQRALAPVVLGALAYWFLAGFVALPEYEGARRALAAALGRRGPGEGPSGEAEAR